MHGSLGTDIVSVIQKVKEVGRTQSSWFIRGEIILLFHRELFMLVVIALVIALPLAYFIMDNWLSDFAVKTNIPWRIFGLVTAVTTILAFMTTSLRIWYATNVNPVESLRSE